ncbi:MAG: RNA polymerase sigma factor [Bacteroidales bacterium]|nr:RNA polymerase sigma factor [Bacteroidales bacterium]
MGLFKKYTDINLIEGIRQQDDKILNWLYDNYFQQVKKHVISNSGSDDDVSDVFQDSIIALYKQIIEDRLNLTTDLKGYFFSIARNVWSAQLRRIRRTSVLETDIADEDDNSLIDDPTLGRVVSRAFLKLKPDQQMVLRLFSEGKSYEAISEIMGFKNETYARRKKYLCKEAVIELVKEDPEYQEYLRLLR